jgi:hypothetical protein
LGLVATLIVSPTALILGTRCKPKGEPELGVYEFLLEDPSPLSKKTIAVMDSLNIHARPRLTYYAGTGLKSLGRVAGLSARSLPIALHLTLRGVGWAIRFVLCLTAWALFLAVVGVAIYLAYRMATTTNLQNIKDVQWETIREALGEVIDWETVTRTIQESVAPAIWSAKDAVGSHLSLNYAPYVIAAIALAVMLVGIPAQVILYDRTLSTRYDIERGRIRITRGLFEQTITSKELYRILDVRLRRSLINRLTRDGVLTVKIANEPDLVLVGLAKWPELKVIQRKLLDIVDLLRKNPYVKDYAITAPSLGHPDITWEGNDRAHHLFGRHTHLRGNHG